MSSEQVNYLSYLLRLRRSDREGRPVWRASLESTRDGQRLGFASVEGLVAFLIARFGATQPDSAETEGEEPGQRGAI
jgi:hypothetical protein